MALQKIVKVTQSQYNTLASGGTVGGYTGLNANYIYLVQDSVTYVDTTSAQTVGGAKTFTSNITAPKFVGSSDKRLKKNIKPYENRGSILDLNVVEYDLISDGSHHIGCIAQDLQEIAPELVVEDSNGYLAVEDSKLVYLLLNEVKRLNKEIEELKKGK